MNFDLESPCANYSQVQIYIKITGDNPGSIHYAERYKVKIKVKFTLEMITKAQRGSRGIALLFP